MINSADIAFNEENFRLLIGQNQQLSAKVSILEKERNTLEERLSILQEKYQLTQEELNWLKRQLFGRKSERFIGADANQLTLELEGMIEKKREEELQTVSYQRKKPSDNEKSGHGRMPLPAHLRREEITIEPEDLPEGSKKIGEEVTEILEYKKAEIYVKKYIRPKYALPKEEGVKVAALPSLPIPKGNAGASLLAHILISKYVDHLPLYRLQQQFKRLGADVSDRTIGGWVAAGGDLLTVVYDTLVSRTQKSDYVQADETPIRVLDKNKKGETHQGYYWVYQSPVEKTVCFQYRKGRGKAGPKEFFEGFRGAVQADGWRAYDMFEKLNGIKLLGCMAHMRRGFDEARDNDLERAQHALTEVQKLYAVERKARESGFDADARKMLRQEEAAPILKGLKAWLIDNAPVQGSKVTPKSKIGVAISYALSMWGRLERYLEDGRYEIDNNLVENSIRPIAIGRKNYLFAGSHEAAQRAAMIYSLMATCKKNDVDPSEWLTDVLARIQDHPINKIDELLPANWKKSPAKDNT
jgi:transposase